jgi:hypothetical protein
MEACHAQASLPSCGSRRSCSGVPPLSGNGARGGSDSSWGRRVEEGMESGPRRAYESLPLLHRKTTPSASAAKKPESHAPFPFRPDRFGSPQQRPTNPLIAPRSIAQWHRQSIARPSYMLRRPVHLAPQVQQVFQSLKSLPPSAGDRSAAPSLDPDRSSPKKARRIRISNDACAPLPLSQLMSEPQRSRLTIRQECGNLYYGINFHYMKNGSNLLSPRREGGRGMRL